MLRAITAAAGAIFFIAVGSAAAATVDGINIHWTSSGNGPALIFVHGWTCDETSWQSQAQAFGKRYRVVTLDLPGHGKSGAPKDGKFSMDLFARAVEAVRSEAKIERAVLVGHSMGTPVIREYALMYPKRVAGLVLADGLVLVVGEGSPFPIPSLTGPEGLKVREGIIRGMFGSTATPALQKHILQMMMGASEATASGAMTATWDASWWKNDVVSVPVLGIYAEKSALANREGMKRLYPNIEYHEIAGTGHFLMMEKPQEFNRLLSDFLTKVKF
jgi:sigma-B regulation protein RsbQ